jgi:hypothetical protein
MFINLKIHLIGIACGALVFLFAWLATYQFGDKKVAEPEVPNIYNLIDKSSTLGVVRLSATKALNRNTVAKWAFAMEDVCQAGRIKLPKSTGIEVAMLATGNATRPMLIPVMTGKKPNGNYTSLKRACIDTGRIGGVAFLMSDSRKVWRGMQEVGVKPVTYAIAATKRPRMGPVPSDTAPDSLKYTPSPSD